MNMIVPGIVVPFRAGNVSSRGAAHLLQTDTKKTYRVTAEQGIQLLPRRRGDATAVSPVSAGPRREIAAKISPLLVHYLVGDGFTATHGHPGIVMLAHSAHMQISPAGRALRHPPQG